MKYISAALAIGYPADCASKGDSYADLLRTWNAAYGSPPPLEAMQPSAVVQGLQTELGPEPKSETEPEPALATKRSWFTRLTFWRPKHDGQ